MSKKAVVEVRENAQKRKNEYFVKGFDITESVEFLLAEVEKDYEFKKQVELQCGLHSCNYILNKQTEKYRKQVSDLEAKLAEVKNSCDYYMNRANDLLIKNQDKISFAVEQLEKAKEWVDKMFNGWKTNQEVNQSAKEGICLALENVEYKIDNQIKQLKEGK